MHKNIPGYDPEYNRRLMLAFALICVLMGFWFYFYELPHRHALYEQEAKAHATAVLKAREVAKLKSTNQSAAAKNTEAQQIIDAKPKPREEVIASAPRLKIATGRLHGSIDLKGARLDDVSLTQYKQTLDKNSPDAALLNPPGTDEPEFIETGWISGDKSITAPDSNSVWKAEGNTNLTTSDPVTLTWDNDQDLKFTIKISVDDNYLFSISQSVQNTGIRKASFFPYALINEAQLVEKSDTKSKKQVSPSHTGPLGVMDKTLKYISYKDLRETPKQEFLDSTGWIGITDQYWAKALVPQAGETYKANFRYTLEGNSEKFQVDYLGNEKSVAPGETATYNSKIFTGAKELKILENYSRKYQIPLFDRVIDFGWLYVLSKPLMQLLLFFNSHIHNVGLSILLLTFCVKLCLFPLARKSYVSMGRMRDLAPKIKALRERYKDDKMELNKQTMQLYKTERVNPASGCLPIMLQIPIFFALIKVFNVSIEMRHTPFYGWIHDLSAPDPTSVFNLFGLIPIDLPTFLIIGAWPCIWACTMYIQQLITPQVSMDPTQQKMMKMLPIFLVFAFSKVPAGLVIYYAFSNSLTICQQLYFLKFHGQKTV